MNIYEGFKSLAFKIDPETIHHHTISTLKNFPFLCEFVSKCSLNKSDEVEVCGVKWKSPIGLAAGLDKNAECIDFFSRIGFGAVEIGTVTPKAQIGNDRPRLFRIQKEKSLRNRMGFNNDGMEKVFGNIQKSDSKVPLGVNIGKNKDTKECDAISDYKKLFMNFHEVADYITINISSPNTPGLRSLQSVSFLKELSQELLNQSSTPILVKIDPDMDEDRLTSVVEGVIDCGFHGLIATNTTKIEAYGDGGVSGELLKEKAKNIRLKVLDITKSHPRFDVVGVGGISSFKDVAEFFENGGKAIQLYTSFIYEGPKVISNILKDYRMNQS